MTFDELKEKAHALPLKPGVYIMQDKRNEIGRASCRERV